MNKHQQIFLCVRKKKLKLVQVFQKSIAFKKTTFPENNDSEKILTGTDKTTPTTRKIQKEEENFIYQLKKK